MNPVIFSLGFIQIRWYAVLMLLAFVIGYLLIIKNSKNLKLPLSKITDMCFYLVIICIIGARLYYCVFNFEEYSKNLLDIFKIWEGGLAIHGGIIAGVIFIIFYTKKNHLPLLKILDVMSISLVLGQAIGRWGNFFNQEAFGPQTTYITLKNLHIPKFIINGMYINHTYYHPTFFYESLSCLIIFITLIVFQKFKFRKTGQIASIYLILYGIVRFFIESLRQDSLMFLNFKVAQIVSILMILIGLSLFIFSYIRRSHD
ncbi:MAG: prolipoprotein diacylglyceryl transferase [bacterium]|nr:prolipoprotein diacylglyceryl transferase [bacterium]